MIRSHYYHSLSFFFFFLITSCVQGEDGNCPILDQSPRDDTGFAGCKYPRSDEARGCFVTALDVLYDDGGVVKHEVMSPEYYIQQVEGGVISEVISVSPASMKCPEIVPCFPLTTKTLVRVGNQIQSRQLSELRLGDDVVVHYTGTTTDMNSNNDDGIVTSKIVNFAHRSIHDDEPVLFVRVRTAKGTVVFGSPDHNIFVQVPSSNRNGHERVTMTFGKLARDHHDFIMHMKDMKGDNNIDDTFDFYLFSHNNSNEDVVKIVSVDTVVLSAGFVAPITESGTMLLQHTTDKTDLEQQQHLGENDDEWIEVSCFSTLPDGLARMIHDIRMFPSSMFGMAANPNDPGVGSGYWMDALGVIANKISFYVIGHSVELPAIFLSGV